MKIRINRIYLLLTICCITIMAGCWDYYEVEQRGYVLGFAIDEASIIDEDVKDDTTYNRELESMELEEGKPKYASLYRCL
jgi:spore germination protein